MRSRNIIYDPPEYDCSSLSLIYFNTDNKLVKIRKDFKVENDYLSLDQTRDINRHIGCAKRDSPSIFKILSEKINNLEEHEVMAILAQCDAGTTLDDAITIVVKSDNGWASSQDPESITSISQLIDLTGIKLNTFRYDDNLSTSSKIFDGIRVFIPVFKRGCLYAQTIELIRKFKKDIDSVVLDKLRARLKRSEIPVNFLKLSNCTFRRDYILEYTFSLKDIITKEDN